MDSMSVIDILFKICYFLDFFVYLIVAVCALTVALYCTKQKFNTTSGWLLLASYGGLLFINIGYLLNDFLLNKMFGYDITNWISVFLTFAGIVLTCVLILALALFRVPKASLPAAKEMTHA
jgi:hypothetical protein